MGRLQGKIALVTGGASVPGLGSATAIRFAAEGATVWLTDIDGAGAERVAASIRANGGDARAIAHDVTQEAAWDQVIAAIQQAHGRLDVLVNNAGIAVLGPLEQVTTANWLRQINVNLNSVFLGAQRAFRLMRQAGPDGKPRGGSIINISSTAGLVGVPGCGSYAAAKGGVRLFTKVVALEGAADGVRCNSVHPGMIATNIQGVALEDNAANYDATMALIPMRRMGTPEEVAAMNLFLASDESSYVTGAEFVIDGGMTAG